VQAQQNGDRFSGMPQAEMQGVCVVVCVCVCVRARCLLRHRTLSVIRRKQSKLLKTNKHFLKKLKKTQALEHAESVLQKKLSNFEKKIRKAEARKRKVLDQLLTLEGYWSGVIPWPSAQLKKNPIFHS
jgi:hypothetical protein